MAGISKAERERRAAEKELEAAIGYALDKVGGFGGVIRNDGETDADFRARIKAPRAAPNGNANTDPFNPNKGVVTVDDVLASRGFPTRPQPSIWTPRDRLHATIACLQLTGQGFGTPWPDRVDAAAKLADEMLGRLAR